MESDEACILIWIYKSEVEDVALHSTTSFFICDTFTSSREIIGRSVQYSEGGYLCTEQC